MVESGLFGTLAFWMYDSGTTLGPLWDHSGITLCSPSSLSSLFFNCLQLTERTNVPRRRIYPRYLYHMGKLNDEFALLVLLAALISVLVFPA